MSPSIILEALIDDSGENHAFGLPPIHLWTTSFEGKPACGGIWRAEDVRASGASSRLMKQVLFVATALCAALPCAVSATTYDLIDLGTLSGGSSAAFAINNLDQVVGWSSSIEPFEYSSGKMISLWPSIGWAANAQDISDTGEIVGWFYPPNQGVQAFAYQDGVETEILYGTASSEAYGVNDAGSIVGGYTRFDGTDDAFLYANGAVTDLGNVDGIGSFATAINNAGAIVGEFATSETYSEAFIYENGQMQPLGILGYGSSANAINNLGEAVGAVELSPSILHAALFAGGSVIDLGTLGSHSDAFGINDSGTIVGYSFEGNQQVGFVYSDSKMQNINDLLAASASGWTVDACTGINEAGDIVGAAINSAGDQYAVILVPQSVPECPPALALASAITSLSIARRFRRRWSVDANKGYEPDAGPGAWHGCAS